MPLTHPSDDKLALAAAILGLVTSTDGRAKPTEDDDLLWARILDDSLTFEDAYEAVVTHRQESPGVWLEPGHINAIVRRLRKRRLDDAGDPPMPGGLTLAAEKAWRVLWCDNVKAGLDRKEAATAASVAMDLPAEIPAAPETVKAGVRAIRELSAAWSIPKGETPDDRRDREQAELRARLAAEDRRKTEADHPGVIPPIDYAGLASEPRGFA